MHETITQNDTYLNIHTYTTQPHNRRKEDTPEDRRKREILSKEQNVRTYIKLLEENSNDSQLVRMILFDNLLHNVTDVPDASLLQALAKMLVQPFISQSPRAFRSVMTSLCWTGKTPFLSALELAMSGEYYNLRNSKK